MKRSILLLAIVFLCVALLVWFFYNPDPMGIVRAELSESPPMSGIMTKWGGFEGSELRFTTYHLDENLADELLNIVKEGSTKPTCNCGLEVNAEIQFKNGKTVTLDITDHRIAFKRVCIRYDRDKYNAFFDRVKSKAEESTLDLDDADTTDEQN
jgi:hypothetical protein